MKPAQIEALFQRFAAATPVPKGELEFINPFTLLVAVTEIEIAKNNTSGETPLQ